MKRILVVLLVLVIALTFGRSLQAQTLNLIGFAVQEDIINATVKYNGIINDIKTGENIGGFILAGIENEQIVFIKDDKKYFACIGGNVSGESSENSTRDSQQIKSEVNLSSTRANNLLPNQNAAQEIIRNNAIDTWGNDHEMVRYEMEIQTEAYNNLVQITEHLDILENAISKWENDFDMIEYEYANQVDAYEDIY